MSPLINVCQMASAVNSGLPRSVMLAVTTSTLVVRWSTVKPQSPRALLTKRSSWGPRPDTSSPGKATPLASAALAPDHDIRREIL